MKVLSLFDGIAGARLALFRAKIPITQYYASEINKASMRIACRNFPKIKQIGDIRGAIDLIDEIKSDLVIFGSPCTDLSVGKKGRLSLEGKQSSLFFDALNILERAKPKYFLMENVASMKPEVRDIISGYLGVKPIEINSNRFVPQNRKRLYWCNWKVREFCSFRNNLTDILLPENQVKDLALSNKALAYMSRRVADGRNHWDFGHYSHSFLVDSACVVANWKKGVPYNVLVDDRFNPALPRYFHPIEAERLQGFPDNYTDGECKGARFEVLGNAFTVPVIEYLLKQI